MAKDYSDLGFKEDHSDLGFVPESSLPEEIPNNHWSLKRAGKNISDFMGGAGETLYNIPENLANLAGKHLYEKGNWGRESGATSAGRFAAPFLLGGPEAKLGYAAAERVLGPGGNALSRALKLASGGFSGGAGVSAEMGQNPLLGGTVGAIGGPLLGQAIPSSFNSLKSGFSALSGKIPANELVKNLQNKASSLKNNLSNMFDYVQNEAVNRNIPKVPVANELFAKVERYLPKTEAFKDLVKQAKTGDYNALRDLQADFRERSEKALSHDLNAERNKGLLIQEARDKINQSIRNHLMDQGHPDLANTLDEAREGYRNYMETYFGNIKLARIFGDDQEIPPNPLNTFKTESTSMNRFKAAHPEVSEQMQKHEEVNKLKKAGKWAGGVAGSVAGAGLLGDYLIHRFL